MEQSNERSDERKRSHEMSNRCQSARNPIVTMLQLTSHLWLRSFPGE